MPHKTAALQPLTWMGFEIESKMNKTYRAQVRKAWMNSSVMFFYDPLHMDVPVLADQQELTSALCRHWM